MVAEIKLSRHMTGAKAGQISGNAYYAVSNEYAENEAIKMLAREVLKSEAKWFEAWGK